MSCLYIESLIFSIKVMMMLMMLMMMVMVIGNYFFGYSIIAMAGFRPKRQKRSDPFVSPENT